MKLLSKFSWRWLAMMLVMPAFLLFTGCDDDTVIVIPVEDGGYIIGTASNFSTPNNAAKFFLGKNEVGQVTRPELAEAYVSLRASGGFNIVTVAGDVETTWGPSSTAWETLPPGSHGDQPNVSFQRGEFVPTTDQFTVPSDGLYHIAFDTELGIVVIVPAGDWGIIGGATPSGWGGSTALTSSGFDFSEIKWTGTQIAMTSGDFKFRYGNGWKIELDPDFDTGETDLGVKVNTNLGGTLAVPSFGGDNITMSGEGLTPGYYTVCVTWNATNGYSLEMTRTGDLPGTDFAAVEMGLVGDGFNDNGGNQWNWDNTYDLHTPAVDGAIFTYTFSGIELNSAGAFKIRNGNNWDGPYILGYSSVTFDGPDAGLLTEAASDDNIQGTDDIVDLVLKVDGNSLAWTCTVTKQ